MGLRKEITLTIKDYNIKLDKDIKFYRNDTIDLCFSILEYGIEVENSIVRSKLMPINTLNAYMYIETPEGTDYVDVTEIDENRVIFKLGTKYSQFVGVGKMQIVIIDNDGCRVTLPSFPFEIKESINSNIGVETPSFGTENGGIIFDEFGHIINPTKISELKEVETLPSNSYAMIIDEEGNKKIKVDTMLDGKIDKVEGLSLVSDTEIARLASVDNYDDAEIRSSLTILESRINSLGEGDRYATKSDLDGKVDKIDGHSLVANTEIEKLAKIDKIPTRLSDLDNNILVTLCENAEVDSGNILGYDKLNNIIVPNGDIEVTLELMNANGIETLTFETSDFTEVKDNTWNIVNYDENGDLIEYAVYIANDIEGQKIILEIYYGTDWDAVMVIKATIKQWQKEVKITSSDVDNVGYESLIRVPSAIEHLAQGKTEGLPTMIYNRLAFGRRNMLRFSEYTVEDMSQTPFVGGIYGKVSIQSSIYGKAINITHTYAEGGINSKGVMLNVTKNKYYSVYFGEQATHSIMGLVVTITDAEGEIIFEHTVNRVPSFGGLHTFISSTETIYVLFAIDRNITNARQIGLYDGMICICDTQEFNNHMNLVYYDNEIEYTPTSDYNPTTKKYVDDLLSNINVDDLDLSLYAKKDEIAPAVETYVLANKDSLKGDKGEKGDQGIQGVQGIQGIQGEKGDKGDKGADGLTTQIKVNGSTYTQENGVITLPDILTDKDISSIIANSKERITYSNYIGNTWLYFPLIQFIPDSASNSGNVTISGRLGGMLDSDSATYNITLLNRSKYVEGNTITATVQAMGEVAKALDVVDIEIYKQSDKSHIAYLKAKSYAFWDISYTTFQHSMIYDGSSSGTATVPSGTLIWSLSSCNKTILSTSGTLSQTGTPSKDTDLVNKAYTESYVNEKTSELSKEITDQQTDLNVHTSNTTIHVTSAEKQVWNNKANKTDIPTKTSQLTNDSGYLTSVPSEYVTESELTSELDKVTVFVTPQMYGAVGDGVHDDTDAFKQAIAENDSVFVPSGTYLIKDTLNVSYKKSIVTDNGQMAKIIFDCDDPSKPVFYIGRNTTISGFFIQPQKIMTEAVIWHDNTKYLKDTGSSSCGSMIENIRLLMGTESPNASFIRITMNSDTARPSGCCFTTFKDIQVDSSCKHYGNGIYLELVQNKEFTEENKAGFPWITHIIFDNVYLGCPYTGIKSRVVVKEGLTRFNRCSMGFIHMNNVSTQNMSLEKTRYYLDVEHIELYMTRCIGWDYHHITNDYKLKVNRIGEGAKLLISDSNMSFGQPLLDCCEFPAEDGTKTVTTAPTYFIEKYFKGTILNEGYDTIDAKIDSKFNTNTFGDIVDAKINEVLYQPIANIMKDPRTSVVRDQYYSASSNGYKNQPGSDLLSIRFPIVAGTNVVRWAPVVVPNDSYCGVYIFPDNTFTNGVYMGSSYSTDSTNLYDAETNSITINNSYNYQYACIMFDYKTLTDIDNFFMTINRDISNNTQTYTEFINENLIEPKINSIEIPTKVSELENDKGYITNSQINIDNIDGEKVNYTNPSGAEYTITITDTGLPTAKPKGYYEGNWVPLSTDENGNIYNGIGCLQGYRLNSSGNIVEATTSCVSGFIPVKIADTIIIGNSEYQTIDASGHYVAFYDENKQLLKVDTYNNIAWATGIGSYYIEGNFYKFQFKISAYSNDYKTFIDKIKYIRASMMLVTADKFDIRITREIGGVTRPVETVNGKNGVVVLKTSDLENDSGYLTQHQDISGKADKTELHNHSNKSVLDAIKTETWTFTLADGSTVTKEVVLK